MPTKTCVKAPSKTLFHLTWDCYVTSISKHGLIPNYNAGSWKVQKANRRSRNHTFLCAQSRKEYWQMTYSDGWVTPQSHTAKLVWLTVKIPNQWVRPDQEASKTHQGKTEQDQYKGDFRCRRTIPPCRIKLQPSHKTAK